MVEPFEKATMNGWTAEEKTFNGSNDIRNISNDSLWTAERQNNCFKRLAVNGWTAKELFWTAGGEQLNG